MQPLDGTGDLESTTELIDRAREGDSAALDRLFARLYTPVRRWARGRLPQAARDLADTDDLVQEALVQTFKRMGGFESRGAGALQAYVRQAILNKIRDELRRARRRPATGAVENVENVEVDGGLSPLEHAIGREAVERYERSLSRLKPGDKEAVIGRIEMGLDYVQLADLLGTSTADAARKRAERALLRLAAEMSADATRSGR